MTKESFPKSKVFKVFLPIVIICMAISLYKSGVNFGQWLYEFLH